MGVGFIVGGFCPGTSLVAMATGKVDGVFFVLGVLTGIFLFGETVSNFAVFFESSYMGRFTLPELFGWSYGVVVLLSWSWHCSCSGARKSRSAMGGETAQKAPRWAVPAAAGLVALAALTMVIGQPDNADRWKMIEAEQIALLDEREVQISPPNC